MSFDRDLRMKEKAKYDDRFKEMESEAATWISEILGRDIIPLDKAEQDLCDVLKDGTILCELANTVIPGSVRSKKSSMPFMQMENISGFLHFSATRLGIPQHDLFQTIDLYERKNILQVVQSIHTFSRYAVQQGLLEARYLGPKMATSKSREFSQEQLNEAKNHVNTLQYGKFSGGAYALRSGRRDPGAFPLSFRPSKYLYS